MSSGYASYKESTAQPNTNQNGLIDVDPANILTEANYSCDILIITRVNPAAMEKPKIDQKQK